MSDNKWSDDTWEEKFYTSLEKATAPISWISSQQARQSRWSRYDIKPQSITNITVSGKFGEDIDEYLHRNYAEYNYRTEVVIIANAKTRTQQYVKFVPPIIDPSLVADMPALVAKIETGQVEFQHIMTNSGSMLLAYAPEINTLFVRTLFDVIHTPDNPDDKFDIEARLGL